jgi:hypothetical protein
MKDYLYRTLLIGSLLVFTLTVNTSPVAAQGSEGLKVTPAIIEDKVTPGDVYRFSITVTNIAPTTKTFTLSAGDIKGLDDAGNPVFAKDGEEPTAYALSSWITIPEPSITLGAGESRTVPYSVRVPTQTSPGAHFGGVFFDSGTAKPTTTGSAVSMKVGTIISLRIAGDVVEEARLREFSTDKMIYSSPVASFIARVENLGNVLTRPHGLVEITDMWGKKVGSVEVNEGGAPVFPGADRSYLAEWQYDGFAFGRYQAVLALNYGDESRKTISATTSFWVLPLKTMALVVGGLLGIIFLLWISVRMYIRNKLRDMGVSSSGADASLYARRYNKAGSRLIVVVLAVVLLCIVALAALFVMFA